MGRGMSGNTTDAVYLVVLALAWLAIPIGAPGTLIMLGVSLLYGWSTSFRELDGRDLWWIAGAALPVEAADQVLGIWAARRYGATFKGILGSLVGAILGSLLLTGVFPIVGTVVGAF